MAINIPEISSKSIIGYQKFRVLTYFEVLHEWKLDLMYLKLRDIFQLIICMVMMFRNLIHYLLLIIGLTKKNNTCSI